MYEYLYTFYTNTSHSLANCMCLVIQSGTFHRWRVYPSHGRSQHDPGRVRRPAAARASTAAATTAAAGTTRRPYEKVG